MGPWNWRDGIHVRETDAGYATTRSHSTVSVATAYRSPLARGPWDGERRAADLLCGAALASMDCLRIVHYILLSRCDDSCTATMPLLWKEHLPRSRLRTKRSMSPLWWIAVRRSRSLGSRSPPSVQDGRERNTFG
jgi:hypothetical protein